MAFEDRPLVHFHMDFYGDETQRERLTQSLSVIRSQLPADSSNLDIIMELINFWVMNHPSQILVSTLFYACQSASMALDHCTVYIMKVPTTGLWSRSLYGCLKSVSCFMKRVAYLSPGEV